MRRQQAGRGCRGAARLARQEAEAWGRTVAAALRPRGQVPAAGTRPEAPAPEPALGGRWGGWEGSGQARRPEARGNCWRPEEGVTGDLPHPRCGMGSGGDTLGPDFCRPGRQWPRSGWRERAAP